MRAEPAQRRNRCRQAQPVIRNAPTQQPSAISFFVADYKRYLFQPLVVGIDVVDVVGAGGLLPWVGRNGANLNAFLCLPDSPIGCRPIRQQHGILGYLRNEGGGNVLARPERQNLGERGSCCALPCDQNGYLLFRQPPLRGGRPALLGGLGKPFLLKPGRFNSNFSFGFWHPFGATREAKRRKKLLLASEVKVPTMADREAAVHNVSWLKGG